MVLLLIVRLLIAWYLTPFSTVFQLMSQWPVTYPCIPGALLTSTPHDILSNPSNLTNVETTDSSERGMNPVTMIIINPWKEYWQSQGWNQWLPVLKSATLPTELRGLAPDGVSWTIRETTNSRNPSAEGKLI